MKKIVKSVFINLNSMAIAVIVKETDIQEVNLKKIIFSKKTKQIFKTNFLL